MTQSLEKQAQQQEELNSLQEEFTTLSDEVAGGDGSKSAMSLKIGYATDPGSAPAGFNESQGTSLNSQAQGAGSDEKMSRLQELSSQMHQIKYSNLQKRDTISVKLYTKQVKQWKPLVK